MEPTRQLRRYTDNGLPLRLDSPSRFLPSFLLRFPSSVTFHRDSESPFRNIENMVARGGAQVQEASKARKTTGVAINNKLKNRRGVGGEGERKFASNVGAACCCICRCRAVHTGRCINLSCNARYRKCIALKYQRGSYQSINPSRPDRIIRSPK